MTEPGPDRAPYHVYLEPVDPEAAMRAPMLPRSRRIVTAIGALALALAATVFGVRWWHDDRGADAAVAAVRAFLEAAEANDVEAAMAWTTGEAAPAATETADWDLVEVRLGRWAGRNLRADVWATIESGGTRLSARFAVEPTSDGWRLRDPFTTVTVDQSMMPHLEVDGVRVPGEAGDREISVALMPGVHRFYENAPPPLSYEDPPLLTLGGHAVEVGSEYDGLVWRFRGFTVDASYETEIDALVAAYLDECVAHPEGAERTGCPFGLDRDYEDDEMRHWTITAYPETAVATHQARVANPEEIVLLDRRSGVATVTATATSGATLELRCAVSVSGLYLALDESEAFVIGPNHDEDASRTSTWNRDYESACEPA